MAVKKSRKLSPQQRQFVNEFLKDQNITKAYQRVYGGTDSVAASNGSRLMRNDKVKTAVEKGLARLADRANITAERNLKRIAEIAYHDKKAGKNVVLKACELVGRALGQFTDNVNSTVKGDFVVATPEQIAQAKKDFKDKL